MRAALTRMPTRVLITTDAVGGVWTYSVTLGQSLRSCGVEVTLAVLGPSPSADQIDTASGLKIIWTDAALDWQADSSDMVAEAAGVIAELVKSTRCELLQLHSPAYLAFGTFAAPTVAMMHSCVGTWWSAVRGGPMPSSLAWRSVLVKTGLANADAVVAPTHSFAQAVAEFYRVSSPIVVANALAPPAGEPDCSHLPAATGPFAFMAGRLWDEGKDVRTLNEAASLIDMAVVAAGATGRDVDGALAFPHLRLPGALSARQMRGMFARQPIFISTAVYEPFGLTVLEAADAGCALVLTDIPTFRELWDGAAVFYPPRDAQKLAQALDDLRRAPLRRLELARGAKLRSAPFSAQAQAQQMLALYGALLSERRLTEAAE